MIPPLDGTAAERTRASKERCRDLKLLRAEATLSYAVAESTLDNREGEAGSRALRRTGEAQLRFHSIPIGSARVLRPTMVRDAGCHAVRVTLPPTPDGDQRLVVDATGSAPCRLFVFGMSRPRRPFHRSREPVGRRKLPQTRLVPALSRHVCPAIHGPGGCQKSGSIISLGVHSWMSTATASR